MKPFRYFALVCFLAFGSAAHAQEFDVPKYKMETAEDYSKYEQDVVACVNWLEATPMTEQELKRKEANAFLVKWISGSPTVTIELNVAMVKFMDKNPALLSMFMGGWARYVIEHKDDNKVKGTLAGLRSVIKVYNMGRGVKKDKEIEKLHKLDQKGELENWIRKNLK